MSTNSNDKTGNAFDLKLLRRIVLLATPYKKYGLIAVFTTISLAVLMPLQPVLIRLSLDKYIANGDLEGLTRMLILLISLLILQTLIMFVNTYLTNWLGQEVISALRVRVFKHLTSLKVKFYDKTPIGTMVTRSVSDIETVANIFSQGIITISGDFLTLFVITFLMFYTDWKLTLICLAVLPLLIYASNQFRKGVKSAFQQVRTQISRLNSFVQEHITGMSVVQIFNREAAEIKKFKEINRLHLEANKKSIFHYAIFFPIVEIITATSIGLMVWYGSRNALSGSITPGVMVSFILYLNMFFRPIRMIADRFNTMQMGMVASERIFALIDDPTYIEENGTHQAEVIGNVKFDNVSFGYIPEEQIIHNISFDVEPGKTLAIVGATGSGKSTLVNLLTKFYDYQSGVISVDDVDIKKWELASLRSQIAFVLQDVFLFSGTVEENIRLVEDRISNTDMLEAAKQIGAHDFIQRMEGGYDYNVMERGSSLSVGQRQLISFARALAFNPKILILDEATSSVDSETEALIQEAITKLMHGRTSIVIAHRLSTIRNADTILVLEKGKVLEKGSHDQLVDQKGAYYKLLMSQQFEEV
ncbi:MAG: ABC transporter ATP-binding protein [Bacteroidetes bacterium]|nr:ABC transporter ATP-binding protein [Bacteroidota bacterium]